MSSESMALPVRGLVFDARAAGPVDLGPIETPVLYVWSTDDPALGREAAESTEHYVSGPYRFVELDGVGHWIPEHAAHDVSSLLLDHLGAPR